MHILLTGAGGFVGHHVLEHFLINTDAIITVTDSFRHHGITDRITEAMKAHPSESHRVKVITHDLMVPFSSILINKIEKNGAVDIILNIASESHVDRSITEPVPFVKNNVDIILTMLELSKALKPRMFLHLSTDEVYGAVPFGRPSKEWDSILPSNPYSASKAAQEAFAISWWRTYNIPLVIINCMNIIGERQDPEKFIPKTINRVLNDEKMTIHASPDGEIGTRHYLHARNLADAMLFIVNNVKPAQYPDKVFPDRFHVVGEQAIDNLTVAKLISGFIGKELDYELISVNTVRPGHDLHYSLDGTKIADLGWEAPLSLQECLKKTTLWSLKHPEWLKK